MSVMTRFTYPAAERRGEMPGRPAVPWATVLPLAVLMAYADGFWLTSLRGAVGAIERTQEPFATWLRESTLSLPLFVLAVLGALTLAVRWLGPVLTKPKTIVAAALLIVAAGTLAGAGEVAASSAYDYHLQANQIQLMNTMAGMIERTSMAEMPGMASTTSVGSIPEQKQASLALQVRALGLGSVILLATNLILVGWVIALRGGRLNLRATRGRAARALQQPGPQEQRHDQSVLHRGVALSLRHRSTALPAATTLALDSAHDNRAHDLRLLLAAGFLGSAALHTAVVPDHLTEWGAAGVFFIVLVAAELAVAGLLLARPQPTVLLAAAIVSIGPLVLWVYSRTLGMPFGPGAGVPEQVGLTDLAACALELTTLLVAVVLLRGKGSLQRRPPASAHVNWLALTAVIAVTAIGLAGSGLAWFDDFGSPGGQMGMTSPQ
ncbi:MAG: hypothetical protein ABIP19_12485 [Dermatophilaceae bacterium]